MLRTDGIPPAFREHFARHNRQALTLALVTLLAAAVLWTVFYIVVYGLILLGLSAIRGDDAVMPAHFPVMFAVCALLLCVTAWITRKIRPNYFPVDRKSASETFLDIILILPRVTFEVWGNFSACRFPSESELRAAWLLLQAMGRSGKLNIHQLPLEIPDPLLRTRVVFLLQLAGLVDVRRYGDDLWLVLEGEKARFFAQSSLRIDTDPRKTALG